MKKILLVLLIFGCTWNISAQDFFRNDFNKRKKYVILTNPTVQNIQTIRYLEHAGLLDINTQKIKFVGVWFDDQNYDFSQTKEYIEEAGLKNFYLHEVRGDLNENNLFEENNCTDDFKTIFQNSVGIFFFGGPDIPPAIYGEENTNSVVTDPQRHFFEATFLFHLLGGFTK